MVIGSGRSSRVQLDTLTRGAAFTSLEEILSYKGLKQYEVRFILNVVAQLTAESAKNRQAVNKVDVPTLDADGDVDGTIPVYIRA